MLQRIKDDFDAVSWADLIQLAGACAVELSGGPRIEMRYGRIDAMDSPAASVSPFGLPDALPPFGGGSDCVEDPAAHLRFVFGKYGMSDEEIVALSGAHTLGRAFKERSGAVDYGYNLPTRYTSRGCPFIGESMTAGGQSWTKEWLKFDNSYYQLPGLEDNEFIAFPTDRCLATDPEFRPYFEEFASNQDAFFASYARAHQKLSELGSKFDRPFSL